VNSKVCDRLWTEAAVLVTGLDEGHYLLSVFFSIFMVEISVLFRFTKSEELRDHSLYVFHR
jgi:hypothetical protein